MHTQTHKSISATKIDGILKAAASSAVIEAKKESKKKNKVLSLRFSFFY